MCGTILCTTMSYPEIAGLTIQEEDLATSLIHDGVEGLQHAASRRSIAKIVECGAESDTVASLLLLENLYEILDPFMGFPRPTDGFDTEADDAPAYRVITGIGGAIALSSRTTLDQTMSLLEEWNTVASAGPYRTVPSPEVGWIDVREQLIEYRDMASKRNFDMHADLANGVLERIQVDGHTCGVMKQISLGAKGVVGSLVRVVLYPR